MNNDTTLPIWFLPKEFNGRFKFSYYLIEIGVVISCNDGKIVLYALSIDNVMSRLYVICPVGS